MADEINDALEKIRLQRERKRARQREKYRLMTPEDKEKARLRKLKSRHNQKGPPVYVTSKEYEIMQELVRDHPEVEPYIHIQLIR